MSENQVNEGSSQEATQEQRDLTKNEIAGLNRKNSELTAALTGLKNDLEALKLERDELQKEKTQTMSESERKDQEFNNLIKEVSTLTTELTSIKQEKKAEEIKAYKLQKLGDAGLSTTFAEFLGGDSAESIDEQIDKLKTTLANEQLAVKKDIMDQSSPLKGSKDSGDITKEKYKSLSFSEQSRLYKENPEKYGAYIK